MWDELPRDLRCIVLDFYGCSSIDLHRHTLLVHAELYGFRLLCKHVGCTLDPSIVRGIQGFKELLELAYVHPEHITLLEHHGGIIP